MIRTACFSHDSKSSHEIRSQSNSKNDLEIIVVIARNVQLAEHGWRAVLINSVTLFPKKKKKRNINMWKQWTGLEASDYDFKPIRFSHNVNILR